MYLPRRRWKKKMEMKKKLISSILMISILASYLPGFKNIMVIPESEASGVKTVWEYEFTGEEQTLILPYKGIYKIEAYGAEGRKYRSR